MGRFQIVDVDDGLRFFYVQSDSTVPFVQIIIQKSEPGRRAEDPAFFQMVAEPDSLTPKLLRFGKLGVPTSLRESFYEGGRPPIVYESEPMRSVPRMEPCLYCGERTVLRDLLNAFAVPGYTPKGKACRNCRRVLIIA